MRACDDGLGWNGCQESSSLKSDHDLRDKGQKGRKAERQKRGFYRGQSGQISMIGTHESTSLGLCAIRLQIINNTVIILRTVNTIILYTIYGP